MIKQYYRTSHTNSTKVISLPIAFTNNNYYVWGCSERTDDGYPNCFIGGAYNKQNDYKTFTYGTSYSSQSESVTNDIFYVEGY